nr:MAG TPA: hypothetical protein [Caudoviricetes sp.]
MIKEKSPRMSLAGALSKPKEDCWNKLPIVFIVSD